MPEKAHRLVGRAIRAGLLAKPTACEACGETPPPIRGRGGALRPGVVYHHHDYSKPLDVIPLCRRCHQHVHYGRIPEPRTGRIYTSHAAYIPPEGGRHRRRLIELTDSTHARIEVVAKRERRSVPQQVDVALSEWIAKRAARGQQ